MSFKNRKNNKNFRRRAPQLLPKPLTTEASHAAHEAEKQARIWTACGEYKWASQHESYAKSLRSGASMEKLKAPCNNGCDQMKPPKDLSRRF